MASNPPHRSSTHQPAPRIVIKEMARQPKNRMLFRQVARDSCGETFDAQEHHSLMFLYSDTPQERNKLVGAASYEFGDVEVTDLENPAYYNKLHYLFIRPYHQRSGLGTRLLRKVEESLSGQLVREIRLDSAGKAVPFFQRNRYKRVGSPMECVCPGSSRFNTLYPMKKKVQAPALPPPPPKSEESQTNPKQKKQFKIYPNPTPSTNTSASQWC